MSDTVLLSGEGLTPDMLAAIAGGAEVELDTPGLLRMGGTASQLDDAIAEGFAIYGVTTGLGPRAVDRLDDDAALTMSLNTIRGRAHAVGTPFDQGTVRAAMAIRANTLLTGASGSRPELVKLVAACLNAGLTPVVRDTGSVGAADLMWGASLGLGLIGEGEIDTPDGVRPAAAAFCSAGLEPFRPGPREGLALASHSSFTAAIAALGLHRAENAFESAQTAAALALEGFRANLSPYRFRALALRPQQGQIAAAAGIAARMEGSVLFEPGNARRVQDPLSLRNIAQIHGAVVAALDSVDMAVRDEINGASDNPVVLARTGEVLSSGGYLTPHLAIVLGTLTQSIVHLSAAQVSRMAKLINPRFTDLPPGLGLGDPGHAGFAPVLKSAEALFAEIAHLAQPTPVYPGGGADGVEDVVTNASSPAKALAQITAKLERLVAMELMIAAQAVELRGAPRIAPQLARTIQRVRASSPPLEHDRPLACDIEALAARVGNGDFLEP